ncbi:MAG: glycosyltransferase family 2 protein [Planctomycetota bacterium]
MATMTKSAPALSAPPIHVRDADAAMGIDADHVVATPEAPAVRDNETSGVDADAMLERIDQTLDLIAEANAVADGRTPVGHVDISVIIPVHNARDTLPEVIDRIHEVMPPATETIIVDSASEDGSWHYARTRAGRTVKAIRRRRDHGRGSAIRMAIRHSQGRVVVIQDADMAYDPADLLGVVWPILENQADVVYGSRYMTRRSSSFDSVSRRWVNRLVTFVSNRLTGLRLSDVRTGHKAFNGVMLRGMPLCETNAGFDAEVTARVAASDAIVMEVPTHHEVVDREQTLHGRLRNVVRTLAAIWRYRRVNNI